MSMKGFLSVTSWYMITPVARESQRASERVSERDAQSVRERENERARKRVGERARDTGRERGSHHDTLGDPPNFTPVLALIHKTLEA